MFPLAAVVTASFDLLTAGLVMTGMMVFYRVPVGWSLLWLPGLMLDLSAAVAVLLLVAARIIPGGWRRHSPMWCRG